MRALLLGLAAASLLGGAACKKQEAPPPQGQAALEQVHSSTGVIKQIKNNGRVLVIDHQEFPGFMEAMTMGFEVQDPGLVKGLAVGDKVEFSIRFSGQAYPITAIKKLSK